MRKSNPSLFRGISFVRLSSIPLHQYEVLISWLSPASIIMIQMEDGSILDDCVQYADYEYWFESFYQKEEDLALQEV